MAVQWFNPYYVFGGDGGSGTGKVFTKTENGLVPAPGAGAGDDLVLRSDGTWGQGGGGSATVGLAVEEKNPSFPSTLTTPDGTTFDTERYYIVRNLNFSPRTFLDGDTVVSNFLSQVSKEYLPSNQNIDLVKEFVTTNREVLASIIDDISSNGQLACLAIGYGNGAYTGLGVGAYDALTPTVQVFIDNTSKIAQIDWTFSEYNEFSGAEKAKNRSSYVLSSSRTVGTKSRKITLPDGTYADVTGNKFNVFLTDNSQGVDPSGIEIGYPIYRQLQSFTGDLPTSISATPTYTYAAVNIDINSSFNRDILGSFVYDSGELKVENVSGAEIFRIPNVANPAGGDTLSVENLQEIVKLTDGSIVFYNKQKQQQFIITSSGGT